ncbi:SAM-dependent methyltransferase [Segeticoccus rhizosphaerae]|uniref:SAM-dependent methyltransferase n=1 Tax=Segeticoccus rhizosphaerae TaxID=1104777 RepID=UPI0010C0F296|nr:SAM-dependent methyltransferase [Ornithinicoccus soli]
MTASLSIALASHAAAHRGSKPAHLNYDNCGSGNDDLAAHWNAAYSREESSTSWYEQQPRMSLSMLDQVGVGSDASIVDIGAGTSRLADTLLTVSAGTPTSPWWTCPRSQCTLRRLASATKPHWSTGLPRDVRTWRRGRTFNAWHDRAVLPFLTSDADQVSYRQTLASVTATGSIAVIATFAPDAPQQCSGLPVARHTADLVGPEWTLTAEARDEHVTPSGMWQPFTWAALRRSSAPRQTPQGQRR